MRKSFFVTMSFILLLTLIPVNTIFGDSQDLSTKSKEEKENINVVELSDDYLEYTYEENEKKYKVIENINKKGDLTKINSEIYELNNQTKEFEKVEIVSTKIIKDEKLIIKSEGLDGTTETREVNLSDGKLNSDDQLEVQSQESSIMSTTPGGGSGEWHYVGTSYYRDWVGGLTVSGITALLINRIPTKGWADVASIAVVIYDNLRNTDRIYYTRKEWHMYDGARIVGIKRQTWIYYDSGRTALVDSANTSYPIVEYEFYY